MLARAEKNNARCRIAHKRRLKTTRRPDYHKNPSTDTSALSRTSDTGVPANSLQAGVVLSSAFTRLPQRPATFTRRARNKVEHSHTAVHHVMKMERALETDVVHTAGHAEGSVMEAIRSFLRG